ncbi:MAG: tetratricopeptide repeat protein, partial [Nannocystaceae bacterium]
SKDDLQSAKLLVALAEPDEKKRDQQVAQVMEEARERDELGAMKNSYIRRSVDKLQPSRVAKASKTTPKRPRDDDNVDTPLATDSDTPETTEPGRTRPSRDPQRARELVRQAQAAHKNGKRAQAKKLYNQALAVDNRNHQALIGLSDLAFDRSKFSEAAKYARKATDASPRKGSYRIKLGDAYYKLLRYRDAHSQYKRAKDLGSREAKSRLLKVRDKLPK